MKVRELLRKIDEIAPFSLAEDWDNVGLMVGNLEAETSRVGLSLDPTSEAIAAAAERGCQVLLAHHPLLFHPVKKLDLNADPGRAVREAVRRDVAILAAHTNWDCVEWGVNGTLARLLGLVEVTPLDSETGLGAKGLLPEPMALEPLMRRIKDAWDLSHLDGYVLPEKDASRLSRVALCGGAGSDFWPAARAWGADLYVTADMKYHELMDANRAGLAIAVADHGEMERASLPELARRLSAFGDFEVLLLDAKGLNAPMRI
ncbi:MAG: Nif3-like dinuclear metal center hexameric protein [Synergistaceae bacterium]|nr:Nif3-like dinuclear metal center hexameric protein [Synergistaceae bacterium]